MEQEKVINEAINSSVGLFFGEYAWVTLLALIAILFKSTIESSVAGLMIFLGRDYDDDDVVFVEYVESEYNDDDIVEVDQYFSECMQ